MSLNKDVVISSIRIKLYFSGWYKSEQTPTCIWERSWHLLLQTSYVKPERISCILHRQQISCFELWRYIYWYFRLMLLHVIFNLLSFWSNAIKHNLKRKRNFLMEGMLGIVSHEFTAFVNLEIYCKALPLWPTPWEGKH